MLDWTKCFKGWKIRQNKNKEFIYREVTVDDIQHLFNCTCVMIFQKCCLHVFHAYLINKIYDSKVRNILKPSFELYFVYQKNNSYMFHMSLIVMTLQICVRLSGVSQHFFRSSLIWLFTQVSWCTKIHTLFHTVYKMVKLVYGLLMAREEH